MDIIIESPGFKASYALESYVTETVGKLKGDKIIRANVTLYKGADSAPENKFCEIRLEVPGNDHFIKKHAESFETATLDAVETLQEMLQKAKDKMLDRNRHVDKETLYEENIAE